MKGGLLLAGFMLVGVASQAADEIEALDVDFLDYLATMESDNDDWTLLDDADHQPASEDRQRDPQAQKPAARKPIEETAKPAVDKP